MKPKIYLTDGGNAYYLDGESLMTAAVLASRDVEWDNPYLVDFDRISTREAKECKRREATLKEMAAWAARQPKRRH